MLERKVYSGWAYKDNADEKARINRELYAELEHKIKRCYVNPRTRLLDCTSEDMEKYCCFISEGHGYANIRYRILSNPYNLSNDELALVCDGGNLCFGYRMDGDVVVVYID
jgi:hypothetical protein